MGALNRLEVMQLDKNRVADAGLIALTSACAAGGFACLSQLYASDNAVGDAGVAALVAALSPPSAAGAAAAPGEVAGVLSQVAAAAVTLPLLEVLGLDNSIAAPHALDALAAACAARQVVLSAASYHQPDATPADQRPLSAARPTSNTSCRTLTAPANPLPAPSYRRPGALGALQGASLRRLDPPARGCGASQRSVLPPLSERPQPTPSWKNVPARVVTR